MLKCTCRFQWLILSKLVFLYCWFWLCQLASSRHGVRLIKLISHMKECSFCAMGEAEVRSDFSFVMGWSFFSKHSKSFQIPVSGLWKLLHSLNLFYFIYFIFLFSIHYRVNARLPLKQCFSLPIYQILRIQPVPKYPSPKF